VSRLKGPALVGIVLFGGLLAQASGQGIFTCVDGKGRRLTADRPIAECMDREQRELTYSGTVKRKIAPELTALERAAEEDKARKAAEGRQRLDEEKKRERALLIRYPDRAAHDKERVLALAQADEVIATASKRTAELATQRKRLDAEREFFNNDPAKLPAKLKRQIEENEQHLDAQKRFVASQEGDRQRLIARFDEELIKLRQLWAQRAAPPAASVPTAAKR
jgi:hypothetical protein